MATDDLMMVAAQIMQKSGNQVSQQELSKRTEGAPMKSANTSASGGITGKGMLPVPLTIPTRDSMVANTTSQRVSEKGVSMVHYGPGNSSQNNNLLGSNRGTAPVAPMNDNKKHPTARGVIQSGEEQHTKAELGYTARERKERAWSEATRSIECITRNVNCFQTADRGQKKKPYPQMDKLNDVPITTDRLQELKETFELLNQNGPQTEGDSTRRNGDFD
ncbi:hypothetical protein R1sor_014403 [Riccia sorocarpa]|uniref:Uncharacterized protein n=1 Tax=Riccia sorocarpa TaxID=122646 RepID=A0ABD3HC55_9MARC